MSVTLLRPKAVAEVFGDNGGNSLMIALENETGEIQKIKTESRSTVQIPFVQHFGVLEVAGPIRDPIFENSPVTLRYVVASGHRNDGIIDLSCADGDLLAPVEMQLETLEKIERGTKVSFALQTRLPSISRPLFCGSLMALCVSPTQILVWAAKKVGGALVLRIRYNFSFSQPITNAIISTTGLIFASERKLTAIPFAGVTEGKERLNIDGSFAQALSMDLPAAVKSFHLALPNATLVLYSDGRFALYGYSTSSRSKRDVLIPLKTDLRADLLASLPQVLPEGTDGLFAFVSAGQSIFYGTLTELLDRFYEWDDQCGGTGSIPNPFPLTVSKVLLTSDPVKSLVVCRMNLIASVSLSSELSLHVVQTTV